MWIAFAAMAAGQLGPLRRPDDVVRRRDEAIEVQ